MSDPGDELLAKEDWRYFAIDRAGTGLGSIATSEWLKKKQEIGFGLPSAPALFLNLAFEAYRKRVGTNVEKLFDEHPESQGTYPENHTPLFDYFETAMSEIIFSYSAIEAALNEIIPSDFIYERAGKAGRPPTRMSAQEIERTISLNEKIKQVLPKALGKISPASGKLWPPYSKLQDLRDRLIHLKSVDRKSSGPEEETIWGRLLKLGATSYPNVASDMINHFYPLIGGGSEFVRELEIFGLNRKIGLLAYPVMIVNEEKSGILKGQISDAFNALKHNGMPRLSIKRIKEIAAKAWAGIHPNSD